MKRKLLLVFCLSLLLSLFAASPTLAADPCDKNYYYADDTVAWCILPDWSVWSRDYDAASALPDMLHNIYDDGIGVDDLGDYGSDTRVAVQVHDPIDNYIVTAQLFVTDFDDRYKSASDYINDAWVEYQGVRYEFKEDDAFGVPVGIVFAEETGGKYSLGWITYPLKEIGRTYTIVLFAPNSAWNDDSMSAQLNLIAYSLFIAEPLTPQATEDAKNTEYDHPVWVGENITKISSESGVGDPNKAFENATWEFFSDSTVTFTPAGIGTDVRADLFPLSGSYSVSGANISYSSGNYTIAGGVISFDMEYDTGNASVLILGDLDVTTGVASISYTVQSSVVDKINNLSGTNTYKVKFTQQLVKQ